MDKDIFFAKFGHLTQGPEGIKKLRDLILQLAVQGKLVEQDADDTPMDESLVAIAAERDRLISTGIINRLKRIPVIEDEELPFEVPACWRWGRYNELLRFIDYRGKTPPKVEAGIPLITAKNVKKGFINREPREFITSDFYHAWMTRGFPEIGDILLTVEAPLGNVALVDLYEEFALAQRVICLQPWLRSELSSKFLMLYIMSPLGQDQLVEKSSGMTAKGIKAQRLKLLPMPLPPLAEQKRIVAKVAELMAVCDELDARQKDHVALKRDCVASTLHHLTEATDTAEINTNWSLIQNNFHTWFNDPQTLKTLRKSLLQLGLQGRLTGAERNVGRNWKIVSLKEVATSRLGKMLDKNKNKGELKPYLRNTNVQWQRFDLDDLKQMKFEEAELKEFSLRSGDLLVCEGGEPGRCAIWNEDDQEIYFQKAIHRVRPSDELLSEFLLYRLLNDSLDGTLSALFTGATIKHLTGKALSSYSFPLPPLAEQRRIVAKVDELMALCDQLEAQITTQSHLTQDLTASLIHHMTAA